MSQKEAKLLYEEFLNSGELFDLFPSLKGDWKEDKKKFITLYTNMQAGLEDDIDLDDQEDFLGEDFTEFY